MTLFDKPLSLRGLPSFFIGGENRTLDMASTAKVALATGSTARALPQSGDYQVGQMYVQGYLGALEDGTRPILMWHGGGMTGATWEMTPDGRPGWVELAARDGFDVYVSDAVERGRSSVPPNAIGEMAVVYRPKALAWQLFRLGLEADYATDPAARRVFPNQRFPTEHYDTFASQFVARWPELTPMVKAAYRAYVERFSGAVVMAHSQGGGYAIETALARPEHVGALVLVEPSGAPAIEDADAIAAMARIPHLVIWGDYFTESSVWRDYRATVERYLDAVRGQGGRVEVIDLPAEGVRGNSHFPMMDDNSTEIWGQVSGWLRGV